MCLFTYCPRGQHFFDYNFYVLMIILVRVFLDPVICGLDVWLVGLYKDGFCSFDVTATVGASVAS